jgi:hypothetical protein
MIVTLAGGMGNQMFQYAFGRSVSAVKQEPLFFQPSWLGPGHARAYSLDAFNVTVNWTQRGKGLVYVESSFQYDPNVYSAVPGSVFNGYWQTEKYFFHRIVREELSLRNPVSAESQRVAENISSGPSAFVHVRRTDYLNPDTAAFHGNIGMDYYAAAMSYVREREPEVRFFVFSDDPDWCRSAFPLDTVVGHNGWGSGDRGPSTEHEDLYLMSLCNHAVICNSSFGWWGAWLGDEATRRPRIVVGPEKWSLLPDPAFCDIMPERWIKL